MADRHVYYMMAARHISMHQGWLALGGYGRLQTAWF
jgi:hypothetical protein